LKERQQYAAKLKKAKALADAKPTDKKLQFQVAAYHAALDDWPSALDAFIAGSNPACAAAAKLEKESATPGQVADAWWSASDIKPDFLSSVIRAHAVDFYRKALSDKSLTGLQKVAAEKRIAEVESAVEAAIAKSGGTPPALIPSAGLAKFTGVKLVGTTVKNKDGILSDFSNTSYGLIDHEFSPGNMPIEVVVEFKMPTAPGSNSCVMSSIGNGVSFMPIFIKSGEIVGYLSSDGRTWDIAKSCPIGCSLRLKETCRLKCTWDGKEYSWFVWRGKWSLLIKLPNKTSLAGGQRLQFGTDRGLGSAFSGTIDLSKCYIKIGGKLWWEGVKGAYNNANR